MVSHVMFSVLYRKAKWGALLLPISTAEKTTLLEPQKLSLVPQLFFLLLHRYLLSSAHPTAIVAKDFKPFVFCLATRQ